VSSKEKGTKVVEERTKKMKAGKRAPRSEEKSSLEGSDRKEGARGMQGKSKRARTEHSLAKKKEAEREGGRSLRHLKRGDEERGSKKIRGGKKCTRKGGTENKRGKHRGEKTV